MNDAAHGYAEGYYGRLLTWKERLQMLDTLQANAQSTYYYAPKEDALHRWQWRTPYSSEWCDDFAEFCAAAKSRGISVVAGVAPGIDFDFHDLYGGKDLDALLGKCKHLLHGGADHVSLLMDDIDADFHTRNGGIASEGQAHAQLSNELSQHLGRPVWVTPRIYANELAQSEEKYLPDFLNTLNRENLVLYCGADIVAKQARAEDLALVASLVGHRLVLWDNLYANDYCPRRLFVGPWSGRESVTDVLLNPTGLINTDCLLMDIMASSRSGNNIMQAWKNALNKHNVPAAFHELTDYFHHPVFNSEAREELLQPTAATFDAIEECLWRWKTPLSREWYPYLYGLKHDLQIARGDVSDLRMRKTQNDPLALALMQFRQS